MRPTGGAVVMDSFPYPPNGIVGLDDEFILLFKKPGRSEWPPLEIREASRLARTDPPAGAGAAAGRSAPR